VRRRLACLETAKSIATETAPDAPTTTRVPLYAPYSYTVLCLSYTALSPVEPPSSQACSPDFHALYTANTSCTVLLSLVVVSPTLALLTIKTRHLPVDHEVLDHRSRASSSC
jgi:hypothetical protein